MKRFWFIKFEKKDIEGHFFEKNMTQSWRVRYIWRGEMMQSKTKL